MSSDSPVQHGNVKASYFWDDGSGINGDTGAPASGEPMQKGLAASPSWPLGTEGYVEYNGKKAEFFIGDRGPGDPAEGCNVLLDLDGKTFAELVGESWNDSSYTVSGGQGHIDVKYTITEWGDGNGTEGAPRPMSGSEVCDEAVSPLPEEEKPAEDEQAQADQAAAEEESEPAAKEEEQQAQDQEEQAPAAGSDDQGPAEGTGVQAETAANDLSGISLASTDLPVAAGALTLAVLPALAVAVLFAKRRPAADYAGDGEDGRHRAPSLLTAEGRQQVFTSLKDRAARLRDEYMR
jgi:hypothetical protein